MGHTSLVVFFGAGASKAFADIPTMQEMVPLFEEEIKPDTEMYNLYSDIREKISETFPDRLDLEAVFSVLNGVAGGFTLKDHGFHVAYEASRLKASVSEGPAPETLVIAKRLQQEFERFIMEKCEIQKERIANLVKLYSKFSMTLDDTDEHGRHSRARVREDWAFYTTNYDLCIEKACEELKIGIDNHFHHRDPPNRRVFSPNRTNPRPGGGDYFQIGKLHGSISWWRLHNGMLIDVPEASMPARDRPEERLMIYPIEEKTLYELPYIELINFFQQDLQKAANWLFIGYRFNDPYLLRVIEYCSDENKKVGIVHPDANSLKEIKLNNVRGTVEPFSELFRDDNTLLKKIGDWLKGPSFPIL